MEMRIFGTVEDSIVDGPGLRYSVFVQGCPHHCPGCHNPETCESWAKQQEERRKERDARWDSKHVYPQSWTERGLFNREGKLRK